MPDPEGPTIATNSPGLTLNVTPPADSLADAARMVGAAATAGYLTAFAAVSFMLETAPSISALVVRDAAVTILLNAIIAVPVFGLVRRILRPVLLAHPAGRRRRAATRETGPIGLRGLEV